MDEKRRISITEKEPEQIAYRSREIAIADGLTDLLGAVKGIRRLSVSGMEQCRRFWKNFIRRILKIAFLRCMHAAVAVWQVLLSR